jgi:hypothetical protein
MYGGLQIAGNTTAIIVPAAGAKLTQGWAAIAASRHGYGDVVPSVADSRLTLVPGVYKVEANLTLETETDAGTSGDGVGIIAGQLFVGGVAVAGTKARIDVQGVDRPQLLRPCGIIEITQAQADAGTNYVEVYLTATDASGNDVTISEGQFLAVKLN